MNMYLLIYLSWHLDQESVTFLVFESNYHWSISLTTQR